jgi:hypothetical protein
MGAQMTNIQHLIEGILPLYDVVERCWPVIERLCGATPRVIAHGNFVEKNPCIKKGTEDVLIAVDWESAGWSTPAIDLAFLYERADDSILAEYCAGGRNNWPGVSVELVRELVHVGVLCRALAALYWEAHVLPYSSSPAAENMLIYARRLSTALAFLGFRPESDVEYLSQPLAYLSPEGAFDGESLNGQPMVFRAGSAAELGEYVVWQRFVTNRAISPQVIQAERVINQLFCAARLQRRSLDHRSSASGWHPFRGLPTPVHINIAAGSQCSVYFK